MNIPLNLNPTASLLVGAVTPVRDISFFEYGGYYILCLSIWLQVQLIIIKYCIMS